MLAQIPWKTDFQMERCMQDYHIEEEDLGLPLASTLSG